MHKLAAFLFEDTASYCTFRMQSMRRIVGIAAFFVTTAIDNAGYLAPAKGSGTHGAGLYSDVERAVGKVLATQFISCSSDSLHLGVGGYVVQRLCQIVGSCYDTVLTDHHGSNGYLALVKSLLSLGKSLIYCSSLFCCSMVQSYKLFLYLCIVNWEIIHIDETDSTNRWLKSQQLTANSKQQTANSQQPSQRHTLTERTAIWADYQTAGRGCGTNTWESERGKNLLFSLLLHPENLPANEQFQISMAISLAIVDALGQLVGDLSIKWPNDIYWRNGKLAGILIENTLKGSFVKDSVVGVGLNVNQREFRSKAPNPVSLWQITGQETDREQLLRAILQAFDNLIDTRESAPSVPFKARYMKMLYRRKGFHPYTDKDGAFMAEIAGIEDDGHLLLTDDNGQQRRYAFKEVQFVI